MPISNNRVLVSPTYNTPIGLYSAENIADTIDRTLKRYLCRVLVSSTYYFYNHFFSFSVDIAVEHHTQESKGYVYMIIYIIILKYINSSFHEIQSTAKPMSTPVHHDNLHQQSVSASQALPPKPAGKF